MCVCVCVCLCVPRVCVCVCVCVCVWVDLPRGGAVLVGADLSEDRGSVLAAREE